MLRLKLLRVVAPHPAAFLHHFPLSSAARFVTEDYLVASCGLTPAQAQKASKCLLRPLKYPGNPDAVRAFLAGIGLTEADITAAVVRDPRLLSCKVDKTLSPCVAKLREMGLSPPQIPGLVAAVPDIFVSPVKVSRLAFYLSFLGSYDMVLQALKRGNYLLRADLENVVRPNILFLQQQCCLTDHDIAKLLVKTTGLLLSKPERVKNLVLHIEEELGVVPRDSGMFKRALRAFHCLNHESRRAKMGFLKKILQCSETELRIALCTMPNILETSEGKMGRAVEFLKVEIGLEPSYILNRLALLTYSIEERMMPRNYVINVLKAKGLLKKEIDFYTAVALSGKKFVDRFVIRYNESVPGLMDAYAAACTGQALLKI